MNEPPLIKAFWDQSLRVVVFFTDHVETETKLFTVCVLVCEAPAYVCYMWTEVSHGPAVDGVTDSLVKFQ